MAQLTAPQFQPMHIGEEAKPQHAVGPRPETLFARRAARFAELAPGHQLEPYLNFLSALSGAQAQTLQDLPPVTMPPSDEIERAIEYGMPPLNRTAFIADDVVLLTLDRLFDLAAAVDMPDIARAALEGVRASDEAERRAMIASVLADSIPAEEVAEHVFVAAGLQVHFARLAAGLDASRLIPVSDGACPACGGPPATSSVVGWEGAHNTRYCACALCATRWNVVRVKCVLCSSTKGIHYEVIEGVSDTISAECCDECGGYVKLLQEIKDSALDPIADDVASLGLDLLVREAGFRRGGVNPFVLGY